MSFILQAELLCALRTSSGMYVEYYLLPLTRATFAHCREHNIYKLSLTHALYSLKALALEKLLSKCA
jgi:hypothetical protein